MSLTRKTGLRNQINYNSFWEENIQKERKGQLV